MKIETFCFILQLFAPTFSFKFDAKSALIVLPTQTQRNNENPTFLFTKPIEKSSDQILEMPTMNTCKYCGESFNSRNAVFRHLRSNQECFLKSQADMPGTKGLNAIQQLEKRKVAIQFGYYSNSDDHEISNLKVNVLAAKAVYKAFFQAFRTSYPSFTIIEGEREDWTLASAARLRHPSLEQEPHCSANTDVIGINFSGSFKGGDINKSILVHQMQNIISDIIKNDGNTSVVIQVINLETLSVSTKFHAEKDCSQRSYRYLIPLRWLDETKDTYQWIKQKVESSSDGHSIRNSVTPQSILKFKKALKLSQSSEMTESSTTGPSPSLSSVMVANSYGRFGKLSNKSRQPWHNFCDPSLGAMANPSNEHIWRTVDKAKLVDFLIDKNHNDEALVVVEFRGDGFSSQQLRRMIAVTIAITRGWLPLDFFSIATRPDVNIETPIAPYGRLYLHTVRYHFLDLINTCNLFDSSTQKSEKKESWLGSLQCRMLSDRSKHAEDESIWLQELKNEITPRIHSELNKAMSDDTAKQTQILQIKTRNVEWKQSLENTIEFPEVPSAFQRVLSLLRDIDRNENWPPTSGLRTRVMRLPDTQQLGTVDILESFKFQGSSPQFPGKSSQHGSFTVVNPQIFNGKLPLANQLFPELVHAIFELEKYLSSTKVESCLHNFPGIEDSLSSSTHCAVNRNIEYTPHVDNGKGKKHSYTTIVSLGNHLGGDLLVEGKPYNIHYNPLQYDGWKQIHSTSPFSGERYSLVWFTQEKRDTTINDGKSECSFEDYTANILVVAHAKANPMFPVLKFRPHSTDSLVINEIFEEDRGCAYEMDFKTLQSMIGTEEKKFPNGFTVNGHKCLLDIGAHIGVFTRYALAKGCQKIYAYEPEMENQKLLKQNIMELDSRTGLLEYSVEIYNDAVAHGDPVIKNFVHARNRNDGSLNTWRHSLEEYSQYVDKEGIQSKGQDSILTRSQVSTRPLFGIEGALRPGVTFVKIDCEGAEIDILLSSESSDPSNWLDVTNLVFEWSFTKERRISKFHEAIQNLRSAQFTVVYEGQGSWWDLGTDCILWPYHNDLIVFAIR